MSAQTTRQLALHAMGLSAEAERLIAERTGVRLLATPQPDAAFISLLGDVSEESLEKALTAPSSGCFEILSADDPEIDRFLSLVSPGEGLWASLVSATAHSVDLARLFCAELGSRLDLDKEREQAMELAVHEALVNALLHGNLEVGPLPKETVEEFITYCNTVEARLADPDYASRRLQLAATWSGGSVTVMVTDRGPGYDADALEVKSDPSRKTGRGLFLIGELAEEVAIEDGGRRLVMRFRR